MGDFMATLKDERIDRITRHIRQAITTRFKGPTDQRDPRVIARAEAGSLTHVWDDSLSERDNHAAAALALADRHGWLGRGDELACGGTGDGYVFVLVPRGGAS
jgi:hypothetical protein